MADVAVVSACFGGFDPVHAQAEQDIEVDFVYFTDDLDLSANGWEVRHANSDLHPRMAAKLPKFFPPDPYRYAIWINGSYEIISSSFVREALEHLNDGIALYEHPYRDCIYGEAEASRLPKYEGQPIGEQVAYYRSQGHPEHWGLWECGAVVWDREHPKVERFASEWLEECERWTVQDQLSFAHLCWRLKVEPGIFPHGLIGSPWVRIHEHIE